MPYSDRHGLIWLERGALVVRDGCVHFETKGGALPLGDYGVPHQSVSMILIGPGTTVSHDALRILARHGTCLCAVGENGTRLYTAPPLGPDRSDVARAQARLWANEKSRLSVARKMYAMRLGEILPHRDIAVLRGIEGARVKKSYKLIADQFGVSWKGRRFDRQNPTAADAANQAINHCASAVQAAAAIAVSALSALPQLGFIHEDSDQSFVLDIADLFRESVTLRCAFQVAKSIEAGGPESIDYLSRTTVGTFLKKHQTISEMIDKTKSVILEGSE